MFYLSDDIGFYLSVDMKDYHNNSRTFNIEYIPLYLFIYFFDYNNFRFMSELINYFGFTILYIKV